MPSASKLTPDGRFIGLFVGPTKSGKTVAACSFPGPIKVFDFDGRIRGILGAPWIDKSQIEYEYYPPRVGRNETPVYQKLNNDLEALLIQCKQNQCPYKTIYLASLTTMTFAILMDAVALTHGPNQQGKSGGKQIGTTNMAGPEDYGFEATNTYNVLAFLRSLPIPNIIVDAHVIDKYGRVDPNDKYSEKTVVGEKLSIRDKIAENVGIYFDHCFRFDRDMVGGKERFTVQFRSDIASTSYEKLPLGVVDITGKPFYPGLMKLANGE